MVCSTKMDEFSENCQYGGGLLPYHKFIFQIFIYIVAILDCVTVPKRANDNVSCNILSSKIRTEGSGGMLGCLVVLDSSTEL